eukprot:TRINITY_DN6189_c0_g1_i1.p2 TRINITY_DN6189_c0_g1~~TRINITY_DN6189_c0_g1_i1.p2  ORF type:complete len:113 (-),score=26.31 TRINITY_DN6189_c0_g1_i1:246-584(-)
MDHISCQHREKKLKIENDYKFTSEDEPEFFRMKEFPDRLSSRGSKESIIAKWKRTLDGIPKTQVPLSDPFLFISEFERDLSCVPSRNTAKLSFNNNININKESILKPIEESE